MEKVKSFFNKKNVINIIILILFIVLATIISLKHEYWADEANSWLIARDSTITSLLTKYSAVDGHPILFFIILKFFQLLGLNYNNLHFISILFSSLGVAIFLFKSNFKWYIKCLIPFTFFIFYQYTVISRSYCLLLLLFSLLAFIWEKRDKHYILFTILLILLTNLEIYTMLIAGSIYFLELISFFKNYKTNKQQKQKITCLIILFLSFLFTTIYMFPKNHIATALIPKDLSIADAFFYSSKYPYFVFIISIITIFGVIIYTYLIQKQTKELLEAAIIFTPTYIFFTFLYANYWHSGIIFITFLFLSWIHNLNKNKVFTIFLFLTCLVQIYWSISSSYKDYKYTYCPSREVANYIKEFNYEDLNIYAKHYTNVAVNAYFKHNIFELYYNDLAFYYISYDNPAIKFSYDLEDIIKINPDIFIAAYSSNEEDIQKGQEKYKPLEENYTIKSFHGKAFFKDEIIKIFEYDVYVKRELIKNKT